MLIELDVNRHKWIIANIIRKIVCKKCGECDIKHRIRCEEMYNEEATKIVEFLARNEVKHKIGQ